MLYIAASDAGRKPWLAREKATRENGGEGIAAGSI